MGPADLAQVLRRLPVFTGDPNVLVGLDSHDDAGVYKLTNDLALVQTVDFFTPIVDDPYAFGQIAAANALSDVYAMGGRPVTALNIVGFPLGKLPMEVLAEILRGGADKVREAGATLIGGHSVDDSEPKYGLAVTGLVHPARVRAKAGARPGDMLLLTKPIGMGVLTTALKRGLVSAEEEARAVRVMAHLNDAAAALADFDVAGLTDVTGFGLLGHAHELARESGLSLRLQAQSVPVLEGAWAYARQGTWPGGTRKNREWLADKLSFAEDVDDATRSLLCDPVTSGGLLAAIRADQVDAVAAALRERGALTAAVIGECVPGSPGWIDVSL